MRGCPGCGTVFVLDLVPTYSTKWQRSGKWCNCGEPLDRVAVDQQDHAFGNVACREAVKAAAYAKVDALAESTFSPPLSIVPNATPTALDVDAIAAAVAARLAPEIQ